MSWTLRFSSRLTYDASQPSIAIPVHIALGSRFVTASAKLDTGASHSIFCREIGEELGLDVAAGERLGIETVTGRFVCFGHGVTLTAAGVMADTSPQSTVFPSTCWDGAASSIGYGWESSTTTACCWQAATMILRIEGIQSGASRRTPRRFAQESRSLRVSVSSGNAPEGT